MVEVHWVNERPEEWFIVLHRRVGIVVGTLTGLVGFVGGWAYAITTYGWFLGGTLGWIPALLLGGLVGMFVGCFWPLFLIVGLAMLADVFGI